MVGQKCVGRANDMRNTGKVKSGRIGADIMLDINTNDIINGNTIKSKPE